MNKKSIDSKKIILPLLFVAYLFVVAVFVFALLQIPTYYHKIETKQVGDMQLDMQAILEQNDVEQQQTGWEQLVKDYPMELVVKNKTTELFTTFQGVEIKDIRHLINDEMVLIRQQGEQTSGTGETYTIMYAMYHTPIMKYLNKQFSSLTIYVGILFFIFLLIITLMNKMLFAPLEAIRQAIHKMKGYRFEEINLPTDNVIAEEFQEFSEKLQHQMQSVSDKYSELELLLMFEKERMNFLFKISRASIHELKTPIHQTLLENEAYMEQFATDGPAMEVLRYNVKRTDYVLNYINEVLSMMKQNIYEIESRSEKFDLIALESELEAQVYFLLEQKNLSFNMIAPEMMFVYMNRFVVHLIMHNVLSNATEHAINNTEIEFELDYTADGQILMSCLNEATPNDIERISQKDFGFNNIISSSYAYSGGHGLKLIQELAESIQGTFTIETTQTEVKITLILPLKAGDNT